MRSQYALVMRRSREGSYTYDSVTLPDTHVLTQLVERLHILFPALAHGNVFDDKALVAPCLQCLNVELGVFGGNVEQRRTAPEGQPAIMVGKELLCHVEVVVVVRKSIRISCRSHARIVAAPLFVRLAQFCADHVRFSLQGDRESFFGGGKKLKTCSARKLRIRSDLFDGASSAWAHMEPCCTGFETGFSGGVRASSISRMT